jgi:hypothetical protein
MSMKKKYLFAIIMIICACCSADSFGAEIEGVSFDNSVELGGVQLNLVGTGLLRYMIFIKAYVAAFYLEEGANSRDALSDIPKRLEIEYFHTIYAEDFAFAANTLIPKNIEPEMMPPLRARIDRMNEWYEDVHPGDRYSLTYIPGKGTELALNGQPKGIIEGADFASATFSMWLGPRPLSRSLKAVLLGSK